MTRCIRLFGLLIVIGTGLAALPVVACPQENVDRLAESDTQALRDADMLAASESISFAVLTSIQFTGHFASVDDVYRFSVEETLRGAGRPTFETPNMIVFGCRHGDQSWHLDRLILGDRVLVLGDISTDGRFWPRYIMPARDPRALRLLALLQGRSAGE